MVGAGNAGRALAADIMHRLSGDEVMFWTPPENRRSFNELSTWLTSHGMVEGCFEVRKIEHAGDFIKATKIIVLTVVTDGQEKVVRQLVGSGLTRDHTLVFFPSNLASLLAERVIREMVDKREAEPDLLDIPMFEISNSPYASRGSGSSVKVSGIKYDLFAAPAYAKRASPSLVTEIDKLFGHRLDWTQNIFGVGLSGENLEVHVPTIVKKWDELIEHMKLPEKEWLNFYRYFQDDDEVEKLQNEVDRDIRAVLAAYGAELEHFGDRMMKRYRHFTKNYREFAITSEAHNAFPMIPDGLEKYHRMYDEDMLQGIVPAKVLAEKAGVEVSALDLMLAHYTEKRGVDPIEAGRNAKALGIEDLSFEEICEKYGVTPGK